MSKHVKTEPHAARNPRAKKKAVDTGSSAGVSSQQSPASQPATQEQPPADKEHKMDITLTLNTKPRKSNRIVIFNGPLNSVQFLRTAFGETIPETITVSGDFQPQQAKPPKVKETPEERKARLAALPKLTLAEKVARAEERAAKLKAKLEAAQANA